MDNSNDKTSGNKYENQIQLRKAKLEKMRKERQMLQFEKLKREMTMQENLEEKIFKKFVHEKAIKINDSKLDEIQREINKFSEDTKNSQTVVLSPHTNESKKRSANQAINLKYSNLQITEIPPIETATYSKHTQTEISQLYIKNIEPKTYEYEEIEYQEDDDVAPLRLFCNFSSNLPPGILSPGLPKVMDIPPALTPIDKANPWNYSRQNSKKILENDCDEFFSKNVQRSLKRASLAMEMVLNNNKNIYVDYSSDFDGYKDINDNSAFLNLNHIFFNKDLTKQRCITSIGWSPHYPEQIAASYYKNEGSPFEIGEDVVIWNQNFRNQTPEQVFHCHSSVTSICFTKMNPHLILGATYSGQIVLWDSRVKTSIPVQCTKLNCKAHTQPIYCLRDVGCESSNYIMSISTDGKLCLWNLDMLAQPTDITQLQLNVSDKIKNPISVTCMDFPANGINNLVLGGEDGYAYSAFRYGYESGINNKYGRHKAPITSISTHYNQATTEFGSLFLTSSIDGNIKLWSIEGSDPLHIFKNNNDYVMDVAWSPIHPGIFVAVDGSGCLDLYNLNDNFEEPIKTINIKEGTAINRVAWNSDGQYVSFGTECGELYLYKIAEDLANPKSEEWNIFKETLHDKRVHFGIEFYD